MLNYTNNKNVRYSINTFKIWNSISIEKKGIEIFQNSEKLEGRISMCIFELDQLYMRDSNHQYFRMHEGEVSSQNGHRNFPGQTTSSITEHRRSPKPTWEGPEKLSCKCDLPPTWLPLGCQQQVHPRENESEAGVTFPANGMQNPGRRERPGKTWSSVPLGDESLPGSKGFPISLNGALIVIPEGGERSGRSLKCDNFVGRQFSIGKRRTDSRRSCFQYLLSIPRLLLTRSLIQKFVPGKVTEHGGRYTEKSRVSIEHEIKDVRVEKFARTGRTWADLC